MARLDRRALRLGLRIPFVLLGFVGALVVALLVHARNPAVRRAAEQLGNTALRDVFEGSLTIHDVTTLSLGRRGRVHASLVEVRAANGELLLHARDVDATLDLVRLVVSLVRTGVPDVDIEEASLRELDVSVDPGNTSTPKLLRALRPRTRPTPSAQASTKDDSETTNEPRVLVRRGFIASADVHGSTPAGPLHLGVRDITTRVELEHGLAHVVIERAATLVHAPRLGFQRVPIEGNTIVSLSTDTAGEHLAWNAQLNGTLGRVPLALEARVDGERAEASLDLFKVDPDALASAIESSPFMASLEVHAKAKGKLPTLDVETRALLGESRLRSRGTLDLRQGLPFRADAEVEHLDLGSLGASLTTDVSAELSTEGVLDAQGVPIGTFRLKTRESALAKSRVPDARIEGRFENGTLNARGSLSAEAIDQELWSARSVTMNGSLRGPWRTPIVNVDLAAGALSFHVRSKAPLTYSRVRGRATIEPSPTLRISHASFELGIPGGEGAMTLHAESLEPSKNTWSAHGVRIEGLGAPIHLEGALAPAGLQLRGEADRIEVHRAARALGLGPLPGLPSDAFLRVTIDMTPTPSGPTGTLALSLARANARLASAEAMLHEGQGFLAARVTLAELGSFEASASDVVLGGPLEASTLERATGFIEIRGTLALPWFAKFLPRARVTSAEGLTTIEGRLERPRPHAAPSARGTLRTQGLRLVVTPEDDTPSITIRGVDLQIHASYNGQTDHTELALLAWDARGTLLNAEAKAFVPLSTWQKRATPLTLADLAELNVNAIVDVPSRPVPSLPLMPEASPLRGRVDAHATLEGTLRAPRITANGHWLDLRFTRASEASLARLIPVDATLDARLDSDHGVASLRLDESLRRSDTKGKRKGSASTPHPGNIRAMALLSNVRPFELLVGLVRGEPLERLPWNASTELQADALRLELLPLPVSMTGRLTARASVMDLNRAPRFEATGSLDAGGINGLVFQRVDATVSGRDGSLFGRATFSDPDGRAEIQVTSKSPRFKGLHATWDSASTTRIDYAVQNGRLALFAPVLDRWASDLDGRMDGAGSLTFDDAAQAFDGGLAIRGANVYANLLGEEISSLNATARFERDGIFRIEQASGKLGGGDFTGHVEGRMKGLSFMKANITLEMANEPVPLSLEGATFAEATGNVRIAASMSRDRKTVVLDVDVPRAKIDLPDHTTRPLQALDAEPSIRIGVRRADGTLDTSVVRKHRGGTGLVATSPRQGTGDARLGTRLNLAFGDEVRLAGRGVDVSLGGRTVVQLADELAITGQIDLKGGAVEVHGRSFTIDRGTVTFPEGGDPSDPLVVAAAYWDAPDRTRIWVELSGPLKSRKFSLFSEPRLSNSEILSVLLFGRPDPNLAATLSSTSPSIGAGGATAVGSGLLTADLNRALSELDEELDVETDTLSGNRTRAKVGRSFLGRRLKVQLGYAPGRATYRDPDTTYVLLNWQLLPKWMLVATRGNAGTSILDVLFQHRW
jgi:translocation and assembly module TamB